MTPHRATAIPSVTTLSSSSTHPSLASRVQNLTRIYDAVLDEAPDSKPVIPVLPPSESKLLAIQVTTLASLIYVETPAATAGSPPTETITWPADWAGNLQLFFQPGSGTGKTAFCDYHRAEWRTLVKFFSHVIHFKGLPHQAQRILQYAASRRSTSVEEKYEFMRTAAERCFYDPKCLQEDGWTTNPSDAVGCNYIGCSVQWGGAEAVIIGFVRDEEIGDLWKIRWIDDTETADLEYGELNRGIKGWERKVLSGSKKRSMAESVQDGLNRGGGGANKLKKRGGDPEYVVSGVDTGIVLAASSHANARPDVLWPARICHDDEVKAGMGGRMKKSNAMSVFVVFMYPYWGKGKGAHGDVQEAIFEYEQVDALPKTIQAYPHSGTTLDLEDLKTNFKLTGLGKGCFESYVNAHRLALGFSNYAGTYLRNEHAESEGFKLMAEMKDCHVMSLRAAVVEEALIGLPWNFVVNQLKAPGLEDSPVEPEQCLNLKALLKCLGPEVSLSVGANGGKMSVVGKKAAGNPLLVLDKGVVRGGVGGGEVDIAQFLTGEFGAVFKQADGDVPMEMQMLGTLFKSQLKLISSFSGGTDLPGILARVLTSTLSLKGHGASVLRSTYPSLDKVKVDAYLKEWRVGCERVYTWSRKMFSGVGVGLGCSSVLTDDRCRLHLTGPGSFERSVRLPAAIQGCKNAGAGAIPSFTLLDGVEQKWCELAKETILPMVHGRKYLNRMRQKILAINDLRISSEGKVVGRGEPLSDDSDGEGGADTGGSKGSFDAAVSGVACAIKAVDMVCKGEVVSAFCATRPPGHHAGTDLRPMGAPSNGFCVLNSVASAAKYAVTPKDQGGFGLSRVCVIDFDVHHGNGTQEILCKTYDPRFLYISMHAGDVSRFPEEEEEEENTDGSDGEEGGRQRSKKKEEEKIFPGDCGGYSPHPGVLNIPMGDIVTSAKVGQALSGGVKNAVSAFMPDLILLSAGFDAHRNDPLGLGGLSTTDFGTITDICCRFAETWCSGRVVSVLEGGYGVPCCKYRGGENLFLPPGVPTEPAEGSNSQEVGAATLQAQILAQAAAANNEKVVAVSEQTRAKIGWTEDYDMDGNNIDDMPSWLSKTLLKCAEEGFVECVQSHVNVLKRRAGGAS